MSRKRNIRGKSDHGSILRQPCRCYLKGTCTRTSCEYWDPLECHFCKNETGCKAGDKCLFPHHKAHEQPNKKPKKGYSSHKRRKKRRQNAVAVVKSVPQLGCVSQNSDALVSQRGKQFRRNPMQTVLGPIRKLSLRLRQASIREKKRTIVGKNKFQSSSSAMSLRYEI